MFNEATLIMATKYEILTKWLKKQLEKYDEIEKQDLELLLLTLGVEINHEEGQL